MSKIKVWTSQGKWSEEIVGMDKIHLMKEAILLACNCVDENEEPIEHPLQDFEIDSIALDDDFDKELDSNADRVFFWSRFSSANPGIKLAEAKSVKLPLGILKIISKEVSYLTPVYDEIIRKAILPSPTPGNYCVILKFEEE